MRKEKETGLYTQTMFQDTRFVTMNFIQDWINGIKDFLGYEAKSYNDIVKKTSEEMFKKIEQNGQVEWFRMEVDRTFSTTLQITVYGQYKR